MDWKPGRSALAAAWALALLPLAGCLEDLGAQAAGPVADLEVSTQTPWAGDAVTFDGRGSQANGAQISLWRFDFGDGTVVEVDSRDEALLQHDYPEPGRYTVTLTVEARQPAGSERDATTLEVGVGERHDVGAALVNDPVGIDSGANYTRPFRVREGATAFRVAIDLASTGVGGARVEVRVLDPVGMELDATEAVVEQGDRERVVLEGLLGRVGEHMLRLHAASGAAEAAGEIQVLHDVPRT